MKTRAVVIIGLLLLSCLSWSAMVCAVEYDPVVERLQFELTELGYEPGPVDGKLGKKTTEALKKYQEEHKLDVSGEFDEKTLKKLRIKAPKFKCSSYSCTVENGLTDEMVKQIKQHVSENRKADDLTLINATNTDLKKLPSLNEEFIALSISRSKYITDITPLGKLTNLAERLTIDTAENVTDLSALSALTQLESLKLRKLGQPLDFASLAQLVKLERLTLMSLNTEPAEAFDIAVLAGKPKLTTLIFDAVQVHELSFLKDSPELSYLRLKEVPVADLSPLAECPKLKSLELHKVPVSDLEPLHGLSKLKTLVLSYTDVTDLSPLTAFKDQLTRLNLTGTKATDMTPVGELSVLRDIFLDETQFDDYSPLAKCSELKFLQARSEKSGFNALEVITSLPKLEKLWLDRNDKIQDWDALKTATSIKGLSVGKTSFSDLSLLEKFTNLEDLNIRECTVIHPEAITSLPKLKRISLHAVQGIDDITIFKDLPMLKDLYLGYRSKQFPQEQIDAIEEAKKTAKE